MSMVLTRSPLEIIGMNGGVTPKRRSARLSGEAHGENEPPAKKTKVNGSSTTVDTKQQDGDSSKAIGKKKHKDYDEDVDGFQFAKKGSKRKTVAQEPASKAMPEDRSTNEGTTSLPPVGEAAAQQPEQPLEKANPPKAAQKKIRRRFPTTPDRDGSEKSTRRSKRLSNERQEESAALSVPVAQASPHRAGHAKSHINTEQSRSPARGRPVTLEKTRKKSGQGVEEEKVMRITLPFADTPIMRRNKEMRKTSAEGHRRSSAGMRGKRASSVIDEGRGHEASEVSPSQSHEHDVREELSEKPSRSNLGHEATDSLRKQHHAESDSLTPAVAMPHTEVPSSEYYKHISADLTEPRRMRCLLGWCGTRHLPSKPDPPTENSPAANQEFQAMQAARIIQAELSQALVTNGILSDWFSRDESIAPQIPLRKKANPRNAANLAKAEELERELERLKKERAEWDELITSAASASLQDEKQVHGGSVSPLQAELLDGPQRIIFEEFRAIAVSSTSASPIQQRLKTISEDLEFAVDQFAHGVHALSSTRETAEQVADKSLADAAKALEEREKQRAASGKSVDQMDALRGLAKVLNSQRR